ncbi:MAG: hypothetical protein ABW217_11135 [Polyangiaceae bacterium]
MKRAKINPRKLLIASIGVATIDYITACSGRAEDVVVVVANLMPPPYEMGVGGNGTVANLVAPPPGVAGATVANLVAPPPPPPGAGGSGNVFVPRDAGSDAAIDAAESDDASLDAR